MTEGWVQLGPVRTWFAAVGDGDPVVFLHPGGVDARALDPTVAGLASALRVYTPERRGHGRTPDVEGPGLSTKLSFADMATDTIAFIEQVVGGPARLAGCSDGGVVALLVALQRPDLVERLACVASVFHRDGWGGGMSGQGDRSDFVRRLDGMHSADPVLTGADLAELSVRTLVMIGDDDEVSIEHAAEFYRSVPAAELAIVPGTSHGLLVEKPALCNAILIDFLTRDAVQTYAPIRRV
ncbi:alpha/beta fold hydrolase [Rhodococcus sp. 077-4]|uniref:alpha/beta fold hydrolase n=1 Tax=Rhodococcus sp. 077-4 TaxID=2789271 RepID=UPI0039F4CC3D